MNLRREVFVLAGEVTNYQCPACGGPLRFAGEAGKLVCDHCGSAFELPVIEQLYADKEQAATGAQPQWDLGAAGGAWSADEAARLRAYSCPSCAAELICDDTTAATACPYCGNPSIVPGQFAGQLRPDCVIPFRLDRAAAIEALKRYYRGKKFLPKTFSEANHIEEIKGVYVPFWLFDGEAEAAMPMRFRGTVVHHHKRGDEEITITEHYRVLREGRVSFRMVPADGSSKMPDAHMDAVEPFDYSALAAFSTAYLPGFLADKYDLDAAACAGRVNERITNSTTDALAATAQGYHSLTPEHSDVRLSQGEVKYALLPVWMLATRWNEQNFLFAMNGQTGKLVGDLPVDKGRYWSWFARIALPIAAVLALLLFWGGIA